MYFETEFRGYWKVTKKDLETAQLPQYKLRGLFRIYRAKFVDFAQAQR